MEIIFRRKNKLLICINTIAFLLLAMWLYAFIIDFRNITVHNTVPQYAKITEDCKVKVIISSKEVCSYEYRGIGYRVSLLNKVEDGIIIYHSSDEPNWYIRFFLLGRLIYGPQSFN